MGNAKESQGLIAVDKMGAKVLFLNPKTYETEIVLDGCFVPADRVIGTRRNPALRLRRLETPWGTRPTR